MFGFQLPHEVSSLQNLRRSCWCWWRIDLICHRNHLVVDCLAEHLIDEDCNRYDDGYADRVFRQFRTGFIS
jgi:hypothetical protein